MNETQREKLNSKLQKHSKIILDVFIITLWATGLIMFAIMGEGILIIAQGIYLEYYLNLFGSNNENQGLIKILHGLELIFVAPLFYLLVLSLTKYVSATKPEINPDSLDIKKNYMNHAIMEIMNVKILSLGLFISVLILHSLSLVLNDMMNVHLIIYICTLLTILIGYYFILDRMVEKLRTMNSSSLVVDSRESNKR